MTQTNKTFNSTKCLSTLSCADILKKRPVIISYNLHGYNQGLTGLYDLINLLQPDIIMIQEHWLSPGNLYKLDNISSDYFVFGSSAMNDRLTAGPLLGRPYGGTAILISKGLAKITVSVTTAERYTIVSVGHWLFINVYMPASGSVDRHDLYVDLLHELSGILLTHSDKSWMIGGDFNVDLDGNSHISQAVNRFMVENKLTRLDLIHPVGSKHTYRNDSLNVCSNIDYFLTNTPDDSVGFNVIELDLNLSDHLPILAVCQIHGTPVFSEPNESSAKVTFLRWDHAPLELYYELTRVQLQPILDEINGLLKYNDLLCTSDIIRLYDSVVAALKYSADQCIPKVAKNFYKFWWNEELSELKRIAIASARIWKDMGKPRQGQIYINYCQDKLRYKKAIREQREYETCVFTNDLHEALLKKSGTKFWKCWNSKFPSKVNNVIQVDGFTDEAEITNRFALYFEKACTPFSSSRNTELREQFNVLKSSYVGDALVESKLFDVGLLASLVSEMGNGKAAGLDGLSAEHLKNCHPVFFTVACKLFNQCLLLGWIPPAFGLSYTVPIPKGDKRCQTGSVSNFRGISVNSVLSKLFEMAILNRYIDYFDTCDSQFGFKKKLSCSHAIYCIRNIVEHYIRGQSTVNMCMIDLSKAFDKVNHYALFLKLFDRKFPIELLNIFIQWFEASATCVKWGTCFSDFFKLLTGVRQGGVLSPYFFAIYVDDIIKKVRSSNLGCYMSAICVAIIMYADDIVLVAPSVDSLQALLTLLERLLDEVDMRINSTKSVCIRFGPRHDAVCSNLTTKSGEQIVWTTACRYLGVYFVSGRTFRCCFDRAKRQFFHSMNAIFSKVGTSMSEEVFINLLRTKCLPILTYAVEACPVNSCIKRSLEFTVTRCFMKVFRTNSAKIVEECQRYMNFLPIAYQIDIKTVNFMQKFAASENFICGLFIGNAYRQINSTLSKYDLPTQSSSRHIKCAINEAFFGIKLVAK